MVSESWRDKLFIVLFSLMVLGTGGDKCTRPCVCTKQHFEALGSKNTLYHVMNCAGRALFYAPQIDDIDVLDLSSNSFYEYPTTLMASSILALILSNNSINSIPNVIDNSNLEYLDLTGNNIQLDDEGFSPGFKNLKTLLIQTTVVFNTSFTGLPKLTELTWTALNETVLEGVLSTPDISRNLKNLVVKTEMVPDELFHSLKQIQEIQLYLGNEVNELSNDVFAVPNPKTMKAILINANNLEIPNREMLMRLEEIREITLELKGVPTLSHDILYTPSSGSQCNMESDTCRNKQNRLYLAKVVIRGVQELPSALLNHISFLNHLEITGTIIPPEGLLNKTRWLKTLKLSTDHIRAVTPYLIPIEMRELTCFNLCSNLIEEIHEDDFDKMPNLERLDVSDNLIHSMHEKALHGLSNLLYLNLSHNSICHLPINAFQKLTSLKQVHLQFNCLDQLDPNMFKTQRNLTHLYLHVNNITHIPDKLFSNLEKLEVLDLSGNIIVNLSRDSLEYFYKSNLERLDLSGNNLMNFPVFRAPENTKLKIVNIGNNPNLMCDCGIVPLIKLVDPELSCAKPDELRGKKISQLDPAELCQGTTDAVISSVQPVPCMDCGRESSASLIPNDTDKQSNSTGNFTVIEFIGSHQSIPNDRGNVILKVDLEENLNSSPSKYPLWAIIVLCVVLLLIVAAFVIGVRRGRWYARSYTVNRK